LTIIGSQRRDFIGPVRRSGWKVARMVTRHDWREAGALPPDP